MRLILAAFAVILAGAAAAAERAEIDRLWRAMDMDGVIRLMRAEGLDYGRTLDEDMLAGQGGEGFLSLVGGLYDEGRMAASARERFAEDLADDDVAPMLAFFEAPLGQRIIALELSAREAMLEPEVEEASRERLAEMDRGGDPRVAQLDRFVAANDLVESNVMGALNASYAFYLGMEQGGALEEDMAEADILADVWSQEEQVRTDTEDWVYAFLALAYQPLDDADLVAYTEFSETPAGRALNRAIFTAFDRMFVDISRGLGLAVARFLVGEEL